MARPSTQIPGLPARRAALRLLDAVLRRGEALDGALAAATRDVPEANDRALAHAIAAEVLRRLPDLDALIDSATPRPLPDDAKPRMVLRMALAQTLVLKTPPHAAIATSLPLLEGGPKRLFHGVFGALSRRAAKLPEPPTLPAPVASRWATEIAASAARAIAVPPPLDLTLLDPSETAHWAEALGGVSLMPGHVRLRDSGAVTALPGFEDGRWWVQDLAASLPARLLGEGKERAVLDLCAAPGGKALQLAAQGWRVTALDRSERRLDRLRENAARTRLAVEIVEADALDWIPTAPASAILLDAPCSSTGIFRRHPDVLHRVRPSDIAATTALQAKLLARAADWLEPGDTLLYAVCSMEPEEGEHRIEALLAARPDLALDPIRREELPEGVLPDERGWLRTLPDMLADQGGLDGFFIARLVRR